MATVREAPPIGDNTPPIEVTPVNQGDSEREATLDEGGVPEETANQERSGAAGENVAREEEEPSFASAGERSVLTAPDVTYDVTFMESAIEQPLEEKAKQEKDEKEEEEKGKEEEGVKEKKEEEGEEEEREKGNEGEDKVEKGEAEKEEIKKKDVDGEKEGEKTAEGKKEESEAGEREEAEERKVKEKTAQGVADESKEGGEGEGTKRDEWMDILGSGGLMKKVLCPGKGVKTRPTPQSQVKLRTKGILATGAVVDKHSSVPFTTGDGDVIQAWDLACSLMEEGEVALLKTSHRFAYGQLGRSPDIPPDAQITYEVELLEVTAPVDFEMIAEEKLFVLIDRKRIRGNELFQRKDYHLAINSYDKALKLIESFFETRGRFAVTTRLTDMRIRCLNNLAAAQLKVEMYKESQEACQKVLEKDPDNVKALYRSGKVFAVQGELNKAIVNLQKAVKLNPDERAIQVELQRTQKKKERVDREEKDMYKRMVDGGAGKETKKTAAKTETASRRQDRWGPVPYMAVAAIVAAIGIGVAYFLTQRS